MAKSIKTRPVSPAYSAWLHSVVQCPCFSEGILRADHPCHKICSVQYSVHIIDRQVPEPYNGDPERAKLIFISSNPSLAVNEEIPTKTWPLHVTEDFFNNRFRPNHPTASVPYVRHPAGTRKYYPAYRPMVNGIYSKRPVRFWGTAAKIAEFLLGKNTTLDDCLLTELVHCKSCKEVGVPEAMSECLGRFFGGFLNLITSTFKSSGRPLYIIISGKKTFNALNDYANKNNYEAIRDYGLTHWTVNGCAVTWVPAEHFSNPVKDPSSDGRGFLNVDEDDIIKIKSNIK